eukprot:CAMPEP_0114559304 /NCGR_PEP_ID=MMETSP0114-20121206/10851_1 /TAXON_ID=31324 /ORGANISM="Goniomonas sp, Strain m" /LENGTH=793 /DNA_ID=CAMNT_0001744767 /DNA_START=43 /DNA_END=2424 /DNA_ORIENTATION=-
MVISRRTGWVGIVLVAVGLATVLAVVVSNLAEPTALESDSAWAESVHDKNQQMRDIAKEQLSQARRSARWAKRHTQSADKEHQLASVEKAKQEVLEKKAELAKANLEEKHVAAALKKAQHKEQLLKHARHMESKMSDQESELADKEEASLSEIMDEYHDDTTHADAKHAASQHYRRLAKQDRAAAEKVESEITSLQSRASKLGAAANADLSAASSERKAASKFDLVATEQHRVAAAVKAQLRSSLKEKSTDLKELVRATKRSAELKAEEASQLANRASQLAILPDSMLLHGHEDVNEAPRTEKLTHTHAQHKAHHSARPGSSEDVALAQTHVHDAVAAKRDELAQAEARVRSESRTEAQRQAALELKADQAPQAAASKRSEKTLHSTESQLMKLIKAAHMAADMLRSEGQKATKSEELLEQEANEDSASAAHQDMLAETYQNGADHAIKTADKLAQSAAAPAPAPAAASTGTADSASSGETVIDHFDVFIKNGHAGKALGAAAAKAAAAKAKAAPAEVATAVDDVDPSLPHAAAEEPSDGKTTGGEGLLNDIERIFAQPENKQLLAQGKLPEGLLTKVASAEEKQKAKAKAKAASPKAKADKAIKEIKKVAKMAEAKIIAKAKAEEAASNAGHVAHKKSAHHLSFFKQAHGTQELAGRQPTRRESRREQYAHLNLPDPREITVMPTDGHSGIGMSDLKEPSNFDAAQDFLNADPAPELSDSAPSSFSSAIAFEQESGGTELLQTGAQVVPETAGQVLAAAAEKRQDAAANMVKYEQETQRETDSRDADNSSIV